MRGHSAVIFWRSLLAVVLLCAALPAMSQTQRAVLLSSTEVTSDDSRLGGLSGLIMLGGAEALAVGDRGLLWTLSLIRDAQEQITDVRAVPRMRLQRGQIRGQPKLRTDTEGLALLPSGRLAVSFEFRPHVAVYPLSPQGAQLRKAKPVRMLVHPGWTGMNHNKQFEALAVDGQGRLYTLPESGTINGMTPVFRWSGAAWHVMGEVPPSGWFQPVGADIGPDGRFYLLERQFAGIGFRSQLRSFVIGEDGLSDMRLHLRTALGAHDNLEGVSIWRDGSGALRAVMVADDNFNPLLRTEIVEYLLR